VRGPAYENSRLPIAVPHCGWLLIGLLSGVGGTQSRPCRVGGDGTNHIDGICWALSGMKCICIIVHS